MTRVLVVDDDLKVRTALRATLERSGYDVDEADSGSEAIRKSGDDSYDAAVVDYQLPPPDGLEVLAQLREAQPRCVRVLMSGALDLPVLMSAVNRGEVSRVLAKPFGRRSVITALEEALAQRNRFEELCLGDRSGLFEGQRRGLEECLSGGLIKLALQPIVGAGRGTVVGYEGLLRSAHASLDTPLRVLHAAETHDSLGRLADVVCARAAEWLRVLPEHLMLFLNVHPSELADSDAVRRRFSALQPAAHRLVIEITERSSMLQLDDWRTTLDYLVSAGFRIAVDDLGSGYNSLSMLAELKPAFIKVDMSIVRNVDREERKQRLLDLLARFSKATDSQLIAEGIETPLEAETVKRIGVDLLQGYFFGRPALELAASAA